MKITETRALRLSAPAREIKTQPRRRSWAEEAEVANPMSRYRSRFCMVSLFHSQMHTCGYVCYATEKHQRMVGTYGILGHLYGGCGAMRSGWQGQRDVIGMVPARFPWRWGRWHGGRRDVQHDTWSRVRKDRVHHVRLRRIAVSPSMIVCP